MEKANGKDVATVKLNKRNCMDEDAHAEGRYTMVCRDKNGVIKWTEDFDNLVTTEGKNFALDAFLSGAGYTVNGPYLGLINGNASQAEASNSMGARGYWLEVGGANSPVYDGNRKVVSFSTAAGGAKSSNSPLTFNIQSAGTIGGCFLALGAGASATKDSTGGILYSAGAFAGGSKVVAQYDSITVTYTASL